jgi:ribosomal protein L21
MTDREIRIAAENYLVKNILEITSKLDQDNLREALIMVYSDGIKRGVKILEVDYNDAILEAEVEARRRDEKVVSYKNLI